MKCSVAWHIVLSTSLQSDFWDMNAVLQGVWYNAWQDVGGGIGDGTGGGGKGVFFLVVRWWTYWVSCTTLG